MRKAKVDKNQPQVVQELRDMGFTVGHTHMVGKGFPDFIVGFGGVDMLVELKSENGTLTKHEKDFIESYTGYVSIAFNSTDVLNDFLKRLKFVRDNASDILDKLSN